MNNRGFFLEWGKGYDDGGGGGGVVKAMGHMQMKKEHFFQDSLDIEGLFVCLILNPALRGLISQCQFDPSFPFILI